MLAGLRQRRRNSKTVFWGQISILSSRDRRVRILSSVSPTPRPVRSSTAVFFQLSFQLAQLAVITVDVETMFQLEQTEFKRLSPLRAQNAFLVKREMMSDWLLGLGRLCTRCGRGDRRTDSGVLAPIGSDRQLQKKKATGAAGIPVRLVDKLWSFDDGQRITSFTLLVHSSGLASERASERVVAVGCRSRETVRLFTGRGSRRMDEERRGERQQDVGALCLSVGRSICLSDILLSKLRFIGAATQHRLTSPWTTRSLSANL